MKCKFKKDYCQICGLSIDNRFNCKSIPDDVIYVFICKKGISETMRPKHSNMMRKKNKDDYKYLGYTKDKDYPKKLITGRIIYKKLS